MRCLHLAVLDLPRLPDNAPANARSHPSPCLPGFLWWSLPSVSIFLEHGQHNLNPKKMGFNQIHISKIRKWLSKTCFFWGTVSLIFQETCLQILIFDLPGPLFRHRHAHTARLPWPIVVPSPKWPEPPGWFDSPHGRFLDLRMTLSKIANPKNTTCSTWVCHSLSQCVFS